MPSGVRIYTTNASSLERFVTQRDGSTPQDGHMNAIKRRVVWIHVVSKLYSDGQKLAEDRLRDDEVNRGVSHLDKMIATGVWQ